MTSVCVTASLAVALISYLGTIASWTAVVKCELFAPLAVCGKERLEEVDYERLVQSVAVSIEW